MRTIVLDDLDEFEAARHGPQCLIVGDMLRRRIMTVFLPEFGHLPRVTTIDCRQPLVEDLERGSLRVCRRHENREGCKENEHRLEHEAGIYQRASFFPWIMIITIILCMNITGIDLNLLIAFESLLDERHVGRAANRVGLSQPAFSNAISR